MALTGVTFRTGPRTSAGERVASGLVLTLGKFDCVIDNASCFAGTSFPANDTVLLFGDLPSTSPPSRSVSPGKSSLSRGRHAQAAPPPPHFAAWRS